MVEAYLKPLAFLVVYFLLFFVAKWLKEILTPYLLDAELSERDNPAIALVLCGYYFGVVAIFVGSLQGPSQSLIYDLANVLLYGLLGLAFLSTSRIVNDQIIFGKFSNAAELVEKQNLAVGAVQFGTYTATGLIAAGSITGTGSVWTAVVFFVLGQLSLFVFSRIYNLFSSYNVHDELENQNFAVGIAKGGSLIALGVIIFNGVSGDFVNWRESLISFAIVNAIGFAFLPVLRLSLDRLVIPKVSLSREIVRDKNVGIGLLEATIAISFAMVLNVLL